ncbi:hypothetical protein [Nocardia sp. NPDC051570]|uniref:terpene synthase family protein n=1 Tax=Nocardia sp. NPDC051570 TaxID=3364324 RepID=UPI00378D9C25
MHTSTEASSGHATRTTHRFEQGPTGLGTSAARIVELRRASDDTDTASPADNDAGLRIPRFTFPWPSACNPAAEQAEQGALAFAARYGLIPNEEYYARLVRTKYGWLAARCYPDANLDLLQILADYFMWFFIVDDMFVDRVETVGESTIPNLTAMIDVLDYRRPGSEPVFGEYAWVDICTRLQLQLSTEHFQRFAHGMRMWAATAGLQILNHLRESSVDIAQYETIRRHTSGTNPCLDVADAAKAGPVRPEEFNDPVAQRLRMHANNVVCWSNDVQSLKMEMRQPGQYWNMVIVYVNKGLTLQQSVDLVAARVRSEIAQFQELGLGVEPLASPQLNGWIDGLRHWMRGYQDWVENDTQRYADAYLDGDSDDRKIVATR